LPDLAKSFLAKISIYRSMLKHAGGRNSAISISMCFSADLVNALCCKEAITCASVRGNLPANYLHDFGRVGIPLAWCHLYGLRRHDFVVAMNCAMAIQIQRFIGYRPYIIGNFIDESPLEIWQTKLIVSDTVHLVFLGALTKRKQPSLFVRSVSELVKRGLKVRASIIGDGPEYSQVRSEIEQFGLQEIVIIHGFLNEPASILCQADVMVLPSMSEGVSRAALESLFLGVPVILRSVDGNSELIEDGVNGTLFIKDSELPDAIMRALQILRHQECRRQLLPDAYRQKIAGSAYLKLIEGDNEIK
jgi:glycosyltransferase involved in cell wall biosynthesis